MKMKNVMIFKTLFLKLVKYFLFDDISLHNEIKEELTEKLDNLVKHEVYTKYKTAATSEEREKNRMKYLKMVLMNDDFINHNQ